jgi:hypothetical protein
MITDGVLVTPRALCCRTTHPPYRPCQLEARLSHALERAHARNSDSQSIDLDTRLKAGRVAKRYGVTVRTIDRWIQKPNLDFPAPTLVLHDVAGRPCVRLWRLGDLIDWERAQAARAASAAASLAR